MWWWYAIGKKGRNWRKQQRASSNTAVSLKKSHYQPRAVRPPRVGEGARRANVTPGSPPLPASRRPRWSGGVVVCGGGMQLRRRDDNMGDDDTVTTRGEKRGGEAAAVAVDCPRLRLPGGWRACSAARAPRERSASTARAQRASASARGRQYPKASRAHRRARSRRRRSRRRSCSARDAGTPMARARRVFRVFRVRELAGRSGSARKTPPLNPPRRSKR